MGQTIESILYLLETVLTDDCSSKTAVLRFNGHGRRNLWLDMYSCLAEKNYRRAKNIAANIFGKEIYKKMIGHNCLSKLHAIIYGIENSIVAKRNRSFSKTAACVLSFAKTIVCQDALKYEVDIHFCVCMDEKEELKNLLLHETSPARNFVSSHHKGMTLIHFAVIWNNIESLQVLLKSVKVEMINQKDYYDLTPLHYAIEHANVMAARILLQAGVDVNANPSNTTPLHLAAFYGYPDLLFLLCDNGADVHSVNSNGDTPLLLATRSRRDLRERLGIHCTIISLLLRFGSSANVQNHLGGTALYYVSLYCSDQKCAQLLLAAGAKLFPPNKQENSASDFFLGNSHSKRQIYEFVKKTQKMPVRLVIACAISVRKCLGISFAAKLKHLQLPREIEKILMFQKLPTLV